MFERNESALGGFVWQSRGGVSPLLGFAGQTSAAPAPLAAAPDLNDAPAKIAAEIAANQSELPDVGALQSAVQDAAPGIEQALTAINMLVQEIAKAQDTSADPSPTETAPVALHAAPEVASIQLSDQDTSETARALSPATTQNVTLASTGNHGGEFDDFPDNAIRLGGDLQDLADLIDDAEYVVNRTIDVLELPSIALKLTQTVRSVADGIEKLADAVRDVPKLGAVAKVVADALDVLTDVLRTIENTLDGFVDRVEVIKENLEKVETTAEKVSEALERGGIANEVAGYAAQLISPIAHDQYEDVDAAGGDTSQTLLHCLDMLAGPYNSVVETIYAPIDATEQQLRDFLTTLTLDSFEKLEGFIEDMGIIEKRLKPLKDPLEDIGAVLDDPTIQKALDAADYVYDAVVAPVLDPILEATGIQNLIDKAADALLDLLPNTDFLNAVESDIGGLEALPDFTGEGSFESYLGLVDILDAVDIDYAAGYDGVPVNVDGGKTDFWRVGTDGADTITADDDGDVVMGEGGKDELTAVHNAKSDVLLGGSGADTLQASGSTGDSTVYDIFNGGRGKDLMLAQGMVMVVYDNSITDYVLSADGDNGVLFVEHVNLSGDAEDDGKDEIRYDSQTMISFNGLSDPVLIEELLEGLQVASSNGEDLTGFDDQNDFLIGARGRNDLIGLGGNDFMAGGDRRDIIEGGDGDDVLDGGNGRDILRGGDGFDTATFASVDKASDYEAPNGLDPFGNDATRGAQVFLGKTGSEQEALGFYSTDQVFDIEQIIGSDRRDIFFGEAGQDNTFFGAGDQDILRGIGRGTEGNYLSGGDDDDALVLDAGGDEAHGNDGSDLFYAAFQDATGAALTGNMIYGGDGDRENVDPGIDILTYRANAISGYTVNLGYEEVLFDDPDRFGTDLDLTQLISGGYVEIYAGAGEVHRFLDGGTGVPEIDRFSGIEVILASVEDDYILADSTPDQIQEIKGQGGDDVFEAPGIEALTEDGAPDLSVLGTALFGNNGADSFYLSGLYDIDGGNDIDTLYLQGDPGQAWYLDLNPNLGTGLYLGADEDDLPWPTPDFTKTYATVTNVEVIYGGAAGDVILAGIDTDSVFGGDGDDTLRSDRSGLTPDAPFYLAGESGDDTLQGGLQSETLDGGAGDDLIDLAFANGFIAATDVGLGGDGADVFYLPSVGATMEIDGGESVFEYEDEDGNLVQEEHEDLADFGRGTTPAGTLFESVIVDLLPEDDPDYISSGGGTANITLTNIENLAGSLQGDELYGDHEANVIYGREGPDLLRGRGGDDVLVGGSGANELYGDDGNDTLWGGRAEDVAGIDSVDGGDGIDVLTFAFARPDPEAGLTVVEDVLGAVAVDLDQAPGGGYTGTATFTPSDGSAATTTWIRDIENLIGTALDDTLEGNDDANVILGGVGDDSIRGGRGEDELQGGLGQDTVRGGRQNDTIFGSAGDDSLDGANGQQDVLDYSQTDAGVVIDRDAGLVEANFEVIQRTWSDTGTSEARAVNGSLDVTPDDVAAIENPRLATKAIHLIDGEAEGILEDGTPVAGFAYDTATVIETFDQTIEDIEAFVGSQGDDTYIASSANDTFLGGDGSDTVDFGADTSGVDVDLGGGTAGASGGLAAGDSYSQVEGLFGGDGADSLQGNGADNHLMGRDGDDTLRGSAGADLLEGGVGADSLRGGGGDDTVSYENASAGVTVNLTDETVTGGEANGDELRSIENAIGSASGDTLIGDGGANRLEGLAGNDSLDGLDGNDTLLGGANADTLNGGAGTDWAIYDTTNDITVSLTETGRQATGQGQDVLSGIENLQSGAGDDNLDGDGAANVLDGGDGDNALSGEGGNDTLIQGSFATATLSGGGGVDQLVLDDAGYVVDLGVETQQDTGSGLLQLSGVEHLETGAGADQLTAGDGAATLRSGAGDDTLTGQGGNDSLDAGDGDDDVQGQGGADTLIGGSGDDALDGGSGDDSLSGGDGADNLAGQAGNDTLDGGDGADILDGGDNADSLTGGDGDDTLDGGDGANTLDGGDGNDTGLLILSGVSYTVGLNTGLITSDGSVSGTLSGIENLISGDGDDDLTGAGGTNILMSGAGDDSIRGNNGDDILIAGSGNDTLRGGNQNDALYGDAGNDELDGGSGEDTLTGGSGDDVFVIDLSEASTTTITDFGDGTDLIEIETAGVDFASLTLSSAGPDVVIDSTAPGASGQILLLGTSLIDLSADSFLFT